MLNLLSVASGQCSVWRPLQSLGTVVVVRARARNALYVLVLSVDVGVLGNFALLGRRLVYAQIWSATGQRD